MRIAVFSDVPGNAHALQALLADIDAQQVDRTYYLGNLVGCGAYPNEVIELIRGRGTAVIRRVAYDVAGTAAVRGSGLPPKFAEMLETDSG